MSADRRVIALDYVGVAGSTGITQRSIAEMAAGTLNFIGSLGLEAIDLLGFSIGSFVAQEIVLTRPDLVNRVAPSPGRRDYLGHTPRAVRRGVRVGRPQPRPAATSDDDHPPRVYRERL